MSHLLRLACVACLVSSGLFCGVASAQMTTTDDSSLRGPSYVGGTKFAGSGISGWHTLGDANGLRTAVSSRAKQAALLDG
jgi:hypothetical protein